MDHTEITNLALLRLFRQCSHLQRGSGRFHGQGRILTLLLRRGKITQRELAEILQRRSATLSEQLDGMEKAGLITREKNAEDKRNLDIALTGEGKEAAQEAEKAFSENADKLFSFLSPREKERLHKMLLRLSGEWQKYAAEGPSEEAQV